MKRAFWLLVALALATLLVWFLGRGKKGAVVPDATPAPSAQLARTAPLATPAPPPGAVEPVPEPVPYDNVTKTAIPERAVVEKLRHRIREFGQRLGGNPVGNNAEITQALNGGNPKGVRFLDPEDVRLNENGELLDPWGTPYFFHQLSAQKMEIHSAGADRQMWTPDDVVVK